MVTHELKVVPKYFYDIKIGLKTFEIRKNDRNFKVGDRIILKEWLNYYSGEELEVFITYITDFAQKDGYVVMGIIKKVGEKHD